MERWPHALHHGCDHPRKMENLTWRTQEIGLDIPAGNIFWSCFILWIYSRACLAYPPVWQMTRLKVILTPPVGLDDHQRSKHDWIDWTDKNVEFGGSGLRAFSLLGVAHCSAQQTAKLPIAFNFHCLLPIIAQLPTGPEKGLRWYCKTRGSFLEKLDLKEYSVQLKRHYMGDWRKVLGAVEKSENMISRLLSVCTQGSSWRSFSFSLCLST